jgi:multidrug transporter EmrE-like cation transporter
MNTIRSTAFFYILGTVLFTVLGQLLIKWGVTKYGSLPEKFTEKVVFLFNLLLDPFIFIGFVSAVSAAFFWMAAMTKYDLSYAYPFTSLSFLLVLVLSTWLFNESLTGHKVVGLALIIVGIVISSRSL